jgi:ribosomal protein S12 methylthiotransferase
MARYKESGPLRKLIVTGCLAQRYAEDLYREMPEVDALVGTNVFKDIDGVLSRVLAGQRVLHLRENDWADGPVEPLPVREGAAEQEVRPGGVAPDPRRLKTGTPYSAYLKIAEGCNNRCSYCAIPLIRGPYVSKPYEQVLAEAKDLAARGVKELIVVAQDTTVYGADLYGRLRLAELLRDLNDIDGIHWIRVLYLYPNTFTDELIEAFATLPKLCHYVDIPLQHASERLLKAMNRHDSMAHTRELLAKLRKRIPDIVIRTTFIVGFPGETEEDFDILKRFVEEQRFENAGVFPYSREENTVAASLPDQIPEEVKEDRYNELMAIQAGISEEIHKDLEGKELEVLVEGYNEDGEDLAEARSYREAPDIDGMIYVENAPGLHPGDFIRVRVDQGFDYDVVALRVDN